MTKSKQSSLINELGNRYGLLTVIGSTKNTENKTVWICQCDCGNIIILKGHDLRRGNNTTCGKGCKLKYLRNNKFKDLTGQKFGHLTVLYFKEINNRHQSVWHCLCDCGKECDVIGCRMVEGVIKSCGCLHSINEEIIEKYLIQREVKFKREQTFPDLVGYCNYYLKYDFAIYLNNNIVGLIEFQGEQHFKSVEYFGGEKAFKKRQYYDQLKKEYAIDHNIPILYLTKNDKLEQKINDFLKIINKGDCDNAIDVLQF